ncbi:nicotinate (nicotinamide) nucleotide adenylyltransferase [Candidatus Pelagibacter sp. HIMB1321]|uniref:nicotinate (nicotinamide) nucleotide adenylyltransferase n=1 Tax=Candidatus Pelagibacter sp. HIMB1321 TaxID=1388755 RepID=UPI000A07FD45|nr:nicotinate (nicotinamide) nucleotide adenylyltransferase [Candidatus Pelagibacter sp. HIMB1321]SMF81558.1 nicotinate-nucleotide adenylyltransferase [Candidatus Pelagibacter sp. HIMB1321]
MEELENKLKINNNKIGILGGSFDPAHKGHLAISKEAKKKFKLKSVVWAITNQNPFKKKASNDLKKRMSFCKKIISKSKFIKIKYFEDIIKSNKTSDLIDYFYKTGKYEIFFLIGADNLINFHKWHKWRNILRKSKLIVFDRHGYKKSSLNSKTYKNLSNKSVTFVEFDKVNISSSQLRKI